MEPGLPFIHIDPLFVVVDKPAGLLAVPGRGPDKQDCVAARVRARFPDCLDQPAVHRLDMATSGLMLLALNQEAHRDLSRQFAARLVEKRYIAILDGSIAAEAGEINLAFRLDPDNRPYQIYDPERGKPGITRWRRISLDQGRTRVEFIPLTGRTHQLRVHAAHPLGLNCPIVGDPLYGHGNAGERLLLHAAWLRFRHPGCGRVMEFTAAPPF